MSVIGKSKYGRVVTIIDCEDYEEALSIKEAWEENGGIAEITMMDE